MKGNIVDCIRNTFSLYFRQHVCTLFPEKRNADQFSSFLKDHVHIRCWLHAEMETGNESNPLKSGLIITALCGRLNQVMVFNYYITLHPASEGIF
jgi:hypothetical protein